MLTQWGWSQSDLARVLGWSAQSLSDVVNRRSRIRPHDAFDLAAALDGTAEEWLLVQARDELSRVMVDPVAEERAREISLRSRIEQVLPTREMIRRGVLPNGRAEEIERSTLLSLGVDSITQISSLPAVARRSGSEDPRAARAQLAWLMEARAKHHSALPPLSPPDEINELGKSLSKTVTSHEEFRQLPQRFAAVGIDLAYVPPYSGARIDGVCTRVENHPLIAVSGRGGRWDKVMFTLAHELAHVALGHLESASLFISDSATNPASAHDPRESQADLLAGHWLIPQFDEMKRTPITLATIEKFAFDHQIPVGLVIGRLQNEGLISWNSSLNKRIESVKEDLEAWT